LRWPIWRLVSATLCLTAAALLLTGLYFIDQTESSIEHAVETCTAPCNVPLSVVDYPEGLLGFIFQCLAVALLIVNVPVMYLGARRSAGTRPGTGSQTPGSGRP
jgi:hypothetical protein